MEFGKNNSQLSRKMYKRKKFLLSLQQEGVRREFRIKNIVNLGGVPLIAWTIKSALKSKYIDELIVTTDSDEIAKISEKYGAIVPFIRPKYLASDDANSRDVLEHAINEYEKIIKDKV